MYKICVWDDFFLFADDNMDYETHTFDTYEEMSAFVETCLSNNKVCLIYKPLKEIQQ